jgi:hypothetical protein
MFLKVVFDKTAFVKNLRLVITLNKTMIYPNQPTDFKNLKKKIRGPKVSTLLPNVCDLQKENHTLGYGLENL